MDITIVYRVANGVIDAFQWIPHPNEWTHGINMYRYMLVSLLDLNSQASNSMKLMSKIIL